MSDEDKGKPQAKIVHGSKEHANMLKSAYGITAVDAAEIVKQRKTDFTSVPFEMFDKARSLLAALNTKPVVTATMERPLSHV